MRTILEARRSLVLAAVLMAGCSVETKGGSGEAAPGSAAVNAPADREALRKLRAVKKACADDAACPSGSYCAPSTKTCTWDCLSSSDCGSGHVCSPDGHCQPGVRSPASAAVPGGPMQVLAAIGEACSFSDECETGSYCERASGMCAQACTSDAECSAGQKCTTQGACVRADGRSLPMTTLSLSPSAFEVSRPLDVSDALARTVRVRVEARRETAAVAQSVSVRVRQRTAGVEDAPGDLQAEVFCGDAGGNAAFGASCTVTMPSFVQTTAGYLSAQIVSVRLKNGANDPTKQWDLVVEGPDAIAPKAPAVFAMPFAVREAAVGVVEGDYKGEYTGALMIGGTEPGAVPAGLTPLRIPVKAMVTDSAVVFVDETRQVSPTGKLVYPRTGSDSYTEHWIAARVADPLHPDALPNTGSVRATIARGANLKSTSGMLTGSVKLTLAGVSDTETTIAFELARTGASPACGPANTCEAGRTCAPATNVCELDAPHMSLDPATNTLVHRRFGAWMTALPSRVQAGLDLIDKKAIGINQFGGFGNFTPAREMVGNELMRDRFSELGYTICDRDFRTYLQNAHSNKGWCGPSGSNLCMKACTLTPPYQPPPLPNRCEELYVDRNGFKFSGVCYPSEDSGSGLASTTAGGSA